MKLNNRDRRNVLSRRAFCAGAAVAGASLCLHRTMAVEPTPQEPIDADLKKRLSPYFIDVCDWIMTLDVGSNKLKNLDAKEPPTWIWVNGNLARALTAGYKITGNKKYLKEAERWCDALVGEQLPVVTPSGKKAGCWDNGAGIKWGDIYLADAGTASTAMAVISRYVDEERRKRYIEAMTRLAVFASEGCLDDPQSKGRGGSKGWVIASGKDRGAFGCGYYRGHLSEAPYTISTAVNGGEFHAILHSVTKNPKYAEISANAIRWILARRLPDGRFPLIVDNEPPPSRWSHNCVMTYCGEGIIAAHTYLDDADLRKHIATEVKPCIEWLLTSQNPDGTWGESGTEDVKRSPGVVTLLAWYYRTIEADPRIAKAVRAYCEFLLNPDNSRRYGVKKMVLVSSFVPLVVADLIQPGSTFN